MGRTVRRPDGTKLGYIAPRLLAEWLTAHVSDKSTPLVGVEFGTSLTSQYLADLGFQKFDGIDITACMLVRDNERGIYCKLSNADATNHPDIEPFSCSAVISSSTFALGHVGCDAIPELVSVLSSNGHFACTLHEDVWSNAGFEQTFSDFEDRNQSPRPNSMATYLFKDAEGG